MSGLVDVLRDAFVLLRVVDAVVVLSRGRGDEDADRIQLARGAEVSMTGFEIPSMRGTEISLRRCHWCAPYAWSAPAPFEGFSVNEVLATDWRILDRSSAQEVQP